MKNLRACLSVLLLMFSFSLVFAHDALAATALQLVDKSVIGQYGNAKIDLGILGSADNKGIARLDLTYKCIKNVTLKNNKGTLLCNGKEIKSKTLKVPVRTADLANDYQVLTGDALNKNKKPQSITFTLKAYDAKGKSLGTAAKKLALKAYDASAIPAPEVLPEPPQAAAAVVPDEVSTIQAIIFTDGIEGDMRGGYVFVTNDAGNLGERFIECGDNGAVEYRKCSNTLGDPEYGYPGYVQPVHNEHYSFHQMEITDANGTKSYSRPASSFLFKPTIDFLPPGTNVIVKVYFKKTEIPFDYKVNLAKNISEKTFAPWGNPEVTVTGALPGQKFNSGEEVTLKIGYNDKLYKYYIAPLKTDYAPSFADATYIPNGGEYTVTLEGSYWTNSGEFYGTYGVALFAIPYARLVGKTDGGAGTGKIAFNDGGLWQDEEGSTSFDYMETDLEVPGISITAIADNDSVFRYWVVTNPYGTMKDVYDERLDLEELVPMTVDLDDPLWMRTGRVAAVFGQKPTYGLTIIKDPASTGDGTVRINGEESWTKIAIEGERVEIEAVPDANSVFGGWSGTCSGTDCLVVDGVHTKIITMDGNKTIYVTFKKKVVNPPPVDSGTGKETSSTSTYLPGEKVVVTATPSLGSVFTGWTGCDTVSGNLCIYTVTEGKRLVTARYSKATFVSVGYYNSTEILPNTQYALTYSGEGSETMLTINGKSILQTYIMGGDLVLIPTSEGWDCDVYGTRCSNSSNGEYIVFEKYYTGPLTKLVKYYPATIFIRATPTSETYASSRSLTNGPIDLELGMAHPTVITLQKYLNSNGYTIETAPGQPGSAGYETNYFGEKTKQALMRYQKDKGISPASGFYGPQTRRMMGM